MNSGNDIFEIFSDTLEPDAIAELRETDASKRAAFILERGRLTESEIARRLAEFSGIREGKAPTPAKNPTERVPLRIISEYACMPCDDGALAVSWPPSPDASKWIAAITGKKPEWKIVPTNALDAALSEAFGVGAESFDGDSDDDFSDIDDADAQEDENAAVIKFVNELVARAKSDRATDIHIEPQKNALAIRFRIDGNLVPLKLPETVSRFKDAVVSRIKIMARLNISEKRRPQDGRITFATKDGGEIDIRVSSLPTIFGESVSLRLLSQKSRPVTIEDLGFMPDDAAKIAVPLSRPHGIILVTGPTGSGKSTTLTAFIRRLRAPEIRIITVEDPVEYEVEGVNQTQVHPEIGLTFSSVLRSVLRQDPDVIMVGEIRDRETADIAIRASLTGHLVLSTLHTNDAAGALTRLVDMGIEPFLIASSVEMILAQRLVRRLCRCAVRADIPRGVLANSLAALGVREDESRFAELVKRPEGCDKCRGIGYFGRIGIFEVLLCDDEIRAMISSRATARDIAELAKSRGMRTLCECGWELVKRGSTSLEEIMCYATQSEGNNARI